MNKIECVFIGVVAGFLIGAISADIHYHNRIQSGVLIYTQDDTK